MVKFRKMLVDNKGFTLIELLVVIAVLGILAAIAIPRLANVRNKAEDTNVETAVGSLRNGLEMYFAEEGNYPNFDISDSSGAGFDTVADEVVDYTTIPDTADYLDSFVGSTSNNDTEYSIKIESANTDKVWEFTHNGFVTSP